MLEDEEKREDDVWLKRQEPVAEGRRPYERETGRRWLKERPSARVDGEEKEDICWRLEGVKERRGLRHCVRVV